LRRGERRAIGEPRHALVEVRRSVLRGVDACQLRLQGDRHEQVRHDTDVRTDESRCRNADDGERHSVEVERPSQNRRTAGVATLPARKAQHGDRLYRLLIVVTQAPADHRSPTKHREIVSGGRHRDELRCSGFARVARRHADESPTSDAGQRSRCLRPRAKIWVGHGAAIARRLRGL
jgi:hypothetical protein